MSYKNTEELLADIHDVARRLKKGEVSVDQAKTEAKIYGDAAKVIAKRIDLARMTGRLKNGSPEVPDMILTSK